MCVDSEYFVDRCLTTKMGKSNVLQFGEYIPLPIPNLSWVDIFYGLYVWTTMYS